MVRLGLGATCWFWVWFGLVLFFSLIVKYIGLSGVAIILQRSCGELFFPEGSKCTFCRSDMAFTRHHIGIKPPSLSACMVVQDTSLGLAQCSYGISIFCMCCEL